MALFGRNREGKNGNLSPLEGLASHRAQRAEAELHLVQRREWWMWFSAVTVSILCGTAFALTAFPSFFRHSEHFYELRSEQVRWGILALLLLFNGWMVYRQWTFRRVRRTAMEERAANTAAEGDVYDASGIDPLTGLLTRAGAEQQLGKEIVRAKRQNSALSLATLHLDDLTEVRQRYGSAAADEALREFARRLKEASRGSDYAVRLASEDFVLVLPKCNLGEVSVILNRVGPLNVTCGNKKISMTYTTGWVDYQPGDMPSDLLKRASQLLHLYDNAAKESFSATGILK
jgi:diguanylate cyclase (GGDEF)-like protein